MDTSSCGSWSKKFENGWPTLWFYRWGKWGPRGSTTYPGYYGQLKGSQPLLTPPSWHADHPTPSSLLLASTQVSIYQVKSGIIYVPSSSRPCMRPGDIQAFVTPQHWAQCRAPGRHWLLVNRWGGKKGAQEGEKAWRCPRKEKTSRRRPPCLSVSQHQWQWWQGF